MAKTAEFHTLLRNYRGIMGNIRINNLWISFDSCFFNYYADDDEIQLSRFHLSFPTIKLMKKTCLKML